MIKLDLQMSDIPQTAFSVGGGTDIEKILKEKYPLNTGWIDLPEQDENLIDDIIKTGEYIKNNYDYFVVVGIGGSYLGARCAINMLAPLSKVLFAGTSFDPYQIDNIIKICKNKKIAVNIISKSGNTMETLICYEILKNNFNLDKNSTFVTTSKGNKLDLYAKEMGFKTFYVPNDVGGRYSVLCPVGLLPMTVAGIDIKKVLKGALEEKISIQKNNENCVNYAVARMFYYKNNLPIEVMTSFMTSLHTFIDWYEQLFMESLGKDKKGLFSACGKYSTDLHSKGQYIQDGTRNFFETFIISENSPVNFILEGIPGYAEDLKGKTLNEINSLVESSTILAHRKDNVPIVKIIIENLDEKNLGALFYFFELSCAYNGILQEVNPFDQNGVETYKQILKNKLKD